jgi:hypothetical protein
MPTLKLRIRGMREAEDARRLVAAITGRPGIFAAVADHHSGCAEIDFEDDLVGYADVIAQIEAAGFEATIAG